MQKYYTADQHDNVVEITKGMFDSYVGLYNYNKEDCGFYIVDNTVYIQVVTEEEIMNFFEEIK